MAGRVFVTVGTTSFDALVQSVMTDEVIRVLRSKGYGHMNIQIGRGTVIPDADACKRRLLDFEITWYRCKPSIIQDMADADLVISHAGAGSCLEVLHCGKPLIVVINETLMDNHQVELAEQMAELGHLVWTKVRDLKETLVSFNASELRPYQPGNPRIFAAFLDRALGVA